MDATHPSILLTNGEYTLNRTPLFILSLIVTSVMLSACSSSATKSSAPWAGDSSQATENTDQATPMAATETSPAAAESSQENAPATHSSSEIRLKPDYPREYVVKKGDTLWGIATKFLKDPWYWPEIWYRNPQVKNPHLIYPGDILTLIYVDGQPRIQVSRAAEGEDVVRRETGQTSQGQKVVKLTPTIRRTHRAIQIPSIPSDAIKQFLTNPRVITKKELETAPYIVASDENHLILGTDNRIYVRGELDKDRVRYSVYRKGDEFVDPDTGDVLGYEIIYAGEARIDVYGQPATATITSSKREILIGDFLLNTDRNDFSHLYYPKIPKQDVDAKIISMFDAISSVTSYQIVVINKGADEGIEVGNVLATYYRGGQQRDKYLARKTVKRGEENRLVVDLPDQRSGLMMIFKVFDRVSYGLILEATRVIRVNDLASKPK